MIYAVHYGYHGVARDDVEGADSALRHAQDLAGRGAKGIQIVDADHQEFTLDQFQAFVAASRGVQPLRDQP
jgi:hypothetical protein